MRFCAQEVCDVALALCFSFLIPVLLIPAALLDIRRPFGGGLLWPIDGVS